AKLFAIGDIERLEIAPGAEPQPTPADRSEVSNTFVLRVDDADRIAAELRAAGARQINSPFDVPDGRIAYFVDPEGHLFGIQSRRPSSTRPEDREATARQERRQRTS
ncbi:MAG: VOC family protein, partial [Dehalococcoidia bacterium]